MSSGRSEALEWNLGRARGVARSVVVSAVGLACALAAIWMHVPPVGAAWLALAVVMFAVAHWPAPRALTVRLEGRRAVARSADAIIWSVERATIRSVLLRRCGSGPYEVVLALRGGGTLIVPARFDADDGYEFASDLWFALQELRACDGYRG